MALPRLTFLYPQLFKSVSQSNATALARPLRDGVQSAGFKTARRQRQEVQSHRYGAAQEPQPPPAGAKNGSKSVKERTLANAIEKDVSAPRKEDAKGQAEQATSSRGQEKVTKTSKKPSETKKAEIVQEAAPATEKQLAGSLDLTTTAPSSPTDTSTKESATPDPEHQYPPLPSVLKMPAPSIESPNEHKPPHLQAPPYVHHFDTFGLVKDLESGGFTTEQSITIMKAVRNILADNLDIARDGLVSKADVENETYLFRAASSELRTEILNLRRSNISTQKTQLSHLQHNHDILAQKTTAELATLRDELKGMLNERRMDTRAASQILDSEISELNYKISVALNSDSKSEVEGLRWVLTRRAAMTIVIMAVLILGSLRWESVKGKREKVVAAKETEGHGGGGGGVASSATQTEDENATGVDGATAGLHNAERVTGRGSGGDYVSLG